MNRYNNMMIEANRFAELRRRILEVEADIDERTLADTLEGATDLHEMIVAVVRSAADDAAMAQALRTRISDMKDRLSRIEMREEGKREAARKTMEDLGLHKVVAPDLTISLKQTPPALAITDERLIPEWFWVPQAPKLDKRAIIDAIKAGTGVSGAELANSRLSLAVRTR